MNEQLFKDILNPEQYRVMRQKGTENAFSGKYWDHEERGWYVCAACDRVMFSSLQKFDAGTGWPSFRKPIRKAHIELYRDKKGQEVRCSNCHSHHGYLVAGDPEHYQVNSAALDFVELGDVELEEGEDEKEKESTQQEPAKKSWAKNLSFAIGGLAFGVAVGVGAAPAAPQAVCLEPIATQSSTPEASASATPTATPAKTPSKTPAPTPTPSPSPTTAGSSSDGGLPATPASI